MVVVDRKGIFRDGTGYRECHTEERRIQALALAKDEAAQEERVHLENQIRAEVTAAISSKLEGEFEQRVAAGIRTKIDAMYKLVP